MLCIRHNITNPYFNLAAEEYFLRESDQEYFLLYIDEPSVLIGKHQNAYAEINYEFIRKNNIKVVRRISGGGAVWHDQGNLNFSFIRNGIVGELVNFRRYMLPVLDFLIGLGLNANFEGKNSIVINGFKVSGNAEHVYKNRILHHGTLLFNTNLANLTEALQVDTKKYFDRAVKSIRSQTINIIDQIKSGMNIAEFKDVFMRHIMAENHNSEIYKMTDSDYQKIHALIENKYSTWEWNYGYSPGYELIRMTNLIGNELKINLKVEKGYISKASITCDQLKLTILEKLEKALAGQKHKEDIILEILSQDWFKDIFERADPDAWLKVFF
jgi:lipoate-protein ligase A